MISRRALIVASVFFAAACAGARRGADEASHTLGSTAAADSTLGAAAPASDEMPRDVRRIAQTDCHSDFATDDIAGFVQEWFGVVAGLQLSVDTHATRQFLADPEGRHLDELYPVLQCGAAAIAPFQESSDAAVRSLARGLTAILAEAMSREKQNAALFRATDWAAYGSLASQSRRWSEIRISTRDLSGRAAQLTERIAGVLREDGRPVLGPGRLRIAQREREVALRYRFRFADLSLLVEYRVDPAGPLSFSARNVLKWLYHGKGLTYADPGALDSTSRPR